MSDYQQYTVIENTPGYMPDSNDPFVGTLWKARAELKRVCAERKDEGLEVEMHLDYAYIKDDNKIHDLGRCVSIEPVEQDAHGGWCIEDHSESAMSGDKEM